MTDNELIDLVAAAITSASADGRTIQSPTTAAMTLFTEGLLRHGPNDPSTGSSWLDSAIRMLESLDEEFLKAGPVDVIHRPVLLAHLRKAQAEARERIAGDLVERDMRGDLVLRDNQGFVESMRKVVDGYASQADVRVPKLVLERLVEMAEAAQVGTGPQPRLDEHRAMDMLESAWGLIANAEEARWDRRDTDWTVAAEQWRDGYHDMLDTWVGPQPPKPGVFRKMPVEVEAMWWDGSAEAATPIINWILESDGTARYVDHPPELHSVACRCDGRGIIPGRGLGASGALPCPETKPTGGRQATINIDTLEGTMETSGGDWVIRGTQGEFYPCKPGPFTDTFEEVIGDDLELGGTPG